MSLPSLVISKPVAPPKFMRLIVTGDDAAGNSFRENAPIVHLHGSECIYESRLRTLAGNSLMIEIPADRAGEQPWRTAAIVESVSPVAKEQNVFHVSVLLGRAYEPGSLPEVSLAAPVRPAADQVSEQQLVRTTALLKPVIAEMVREAVLAESERQARQLRNELAREIEKAVREPLAVMAQYAESLPAVDQDMVRRLLAEAAEAEFQRAIATIEPAIAETLRGAVAAEYEHQTQQLKAEVFSEVGKAVQGPVALQIAVMLDKALASRATADEKQNQPARGLDESMSIDELLRKLQAKLDASGGTMRCVLQPKAVGPAPAAAGQL